MRYGSFTCWRQKSSLLFDMVSPRAQDFIQIELSSELTLSISNESLSESGLFGKMNFAAVFYLYASYCENACIFNTRMQ